MKKFGCLLTVIWLATCLTAFAQEEIMGNWLNPEKNTVMQIYSNGGVYFGKLIGGSALYEVDKKTLKKDVNNPSPTLKNRTMLNQDIITNLQFKHGKWEDGKVYDANSGKTYGCMIKVNGSTLDLRGYVGSPAFGQTSVWTKVNK